VKKLNGKYRKSLEAVSLESVKVFLQHNGYRNLIHISLNYGFLLVLCAAYCVLGVKKAQKGKMSLPQKYIHFFTFEIAVLLFGLMVELCFRAWQPSLSSVSAFPRTFLWLGLAGTLLYTKFVLLTHAAEAFSEPKWFASKMKDTRSVIAGLMLLIASLVFLIAAYAGPAAERIPALLLKALVPGIV